MTTITPLAIVGYAAARPATALTTAKQVAWLWETPGGHAGVIAWTGVYWALTGWGEIDPPEAAALKRRTPKANPAEHPWLGTCAWDAGFRRWWPHRPPTPASDRQQGYLAALGAPPPAGIPKALAGATLDRLRLARAFLRGQLQPPGLPEADPVQVQAAIGFLAGPQTTLAAYWNAVRALDVALFPGLANPPGT